MDSKAFRIFSRTSLLVLALTLACAGAARADTFSNGQFVTYVPGEWGVDATRPGATLLLADYLSVYAATSGLLTVGLPNTGFTMIFSSPVDVIGYLPDVGTPAPLDQNLVNPLSSSSGDFGSEVLALQLNVDFSNAGLLAHPSGTPFGNLVLQNLTTTPALNGLTVSQFLSDANTCLGGGSCLYSFSVMDGVTADLTLSFDAFGVGQVGFNPGVPSSFAQTNLALPGSVTATPEPSSLLLLGAGMLGLGIFQYRRRGSASSTLG
jgi:hypothetical protein